MKPEHQVKTDLLTLLGKLGLKTAQAVLDDMCAQFGDGSDGDLIISSQIVSLKRDMHFRNLTITGTGKIETNGYRIYTQRVLDLTGTTGGAIVYGGTKQSPSK